MLGVGTLPFTMTARGAEGGHPQSGELCGVGQVFWEAGEMEDGSHAHPGPHSCPGVTLPLPHSPRRVAITRSHLQFPQGAISRLLIYSLAVTSALSNKALPGGGRLAAGAGRARAAAYLFPGHLPP